MIKLPKLSILLQPRRSMRTKIDLVREACISHVEEYFCNQMINQMENNELDNAQCLHEEFVVSGEDVVNQWLFINDLTEDEI